MKSEEFARLLSPFSLFSNRAALSVANKSIRLSADGLSAVSSLGVLERALPLPLEKGKQAVVNTAGLLAVARSLPPGKDLELTIKKQHLHWACGAAEGRLALVSESVEIPLVEDLVEEEPVMLALPPKARSALASALDIGGLSCGPSAMSSAGLYGVVLDTADGNIMVYSSDSVTVACAIVPLAQFTVKGSNTVLDGFPDRTTLSPDCAGLLSTLMLGVGSVTGELSVTSEQIYYADGTTRFVSRPLPPVRQDLRAIMADLEGHKQTAGFSRDRIASFVRRAANLAETKQQVLVELVLEDKGVSLLFAEAGADASEYFVTKGVEHANAGASVKLDATRIARALVHSDALVFDHIPRGVLILRKADALFTYYISGVQEQRTS